MKTVMERLGELLLQVSTFALARAGSSFQTYSCKEDPNTVKERISLAGRVSSLTGRCSLIALHAPRDMSSVEEATRVKEMLDEHSLTPATVYAEIYHQQKRGVLDHRLMYGTLTSPCPEVRVASINQLLSALDLMRTVKCRQLTFPLLDGIDSPGEKNITDMLEQILSGLRQVGLKIRKSETMQICFRPIDPSFCAVAVPDWGTAAWLCRETDSSCRVLLDTGSLLPGESVESVIISMLHQKILGTVSLSDNRLSQGRLPAGSLDSGALFRIFLNLLEAEKTGLCSLSDMVFEVGITTRVASPAEGLIQAIENIEHALARAALVNLDELRILQSKPDPWSANRLLVDAFATDVRPVVRAWREDNNLPANPLEAYRQN
jgi:L-rhamnose isomerase/sugar isomerase